MVLPVTTSPAPRLIAAWINFAHCSIGCSAAGVSASIGAAPSAGADSSAPAPAAGAGAGSGFGASGFGAGRLAMGLHTRSRVSRFLVMSDVSRTGSSHLASFDCRASFSPVV